MAMQRFCNPSIGVRFLVSAPDIFQCSIMAMHRAVNSKNQRLTYLLKITIHIVNSDKRVVLCYNMDMKHELYFFTDIENGMMYFGKTSVGKYGNGVEIKKAFKEKGKDKFIFGIMGRFSSAELLEEAEKVMVTVETGKNPMMYNLKSGGNSNNYQHENTKIKISESLKGTKHVNRKRVPSSEEKKKKISEKLKGRKLSQQTINKIIEKNKKSCKVKGIEFNSHEEAAHYFKVTKSCISMWKKRGKI